MEWNVDVELNILLNSKMNAQLSNEKHNGHSRKV